MISKIEFPSVGEPQKVRFRDLKVNDHFVYNSKLHQKITVPYDTEGYAANCNCFDIHDGAFDCIFDSELVSPAYIIVNVP